MSQIWLEVKEEKNKNRILFYFAPSKNLLSKYGNIGNFPQNVTTLVHFFQDFFCMLYARFLALPIGKRISIGCMIWM
jgi:hypothetical protein